MNNAMTQEEIEQLECAKALLKEKKIEEARQAAAPIFARYHAQKLNLTNELAAFVGAFVSLQQGHVEAVQLL